MFILTRKLQHPNSMFVFPVRPLFWSHWEEINCLSANHVLCVAVSNYWGALISLSRHRAHFRLAAPPLDSLIFDLSVISHWVHNKLQKLKTSLIYFDPKRTAVNVRHSSRYWTIWSEMFLFTRAFCCLADCERWPHLMVHQNSKYDSKNNHNTGRSWKILTVAPRPCLEFWWARSLNRRDSFKINVPG